MAKIGNNNYQTMASGLKMSDFSTWLKAEGGDEERMLQFVGKKVSASKSKGVKLPKSTSGVGLQTLASANKAASKTARQVFLQFVLKQCGVTTKEALPESVKTAMGLNSPKGSKRWDEGKSSPLLARRIGKVLKSVKAYKKGLDRRAGTKGSSTVRGTSVRSAAAVTKSRSKHDSPAVRLERALANFKDVGNSITIERQGPKSDRGYYAGGHVMLDGRGGCISVMGRARTNGDFLANGFLTNNPRKGYHDLTYGDLIEVLKDVTNLNDEGVCDLVERLTLVELAKPGSGKGKAKVKSTIVGGARCDTKNNKIRIQRTERRSTEELSREYTYQPGDAKK